MKTYEDFQSEAENKDDTTKALFCRSAVKEFQSSDEYRHAADGEAYYMKHNITMEKYQKFLYKITGEKVADTISANYKLKSTIFRRLVTQQVQYVLGNGVTFENPETKEKLGRDFDFQLQKASKRAMAEGQAFGFWNMDHLEIFGYANTKWDAGFCPLYSEETSALMVGIRFWFSRVNNSTVFRATLYEQDGFTDYSIDSEDNVTVRNPKRAYVVTEVKERSGELETSYGTNYGKLPIIPLYVNDSHESELVGIRECIDCYDFIKSGFANQIDDLNGIFWIVKNAGGMDDTDLAQFLQRLKTVHAASIDADGGVDAEAKTVDIPAEARKTMLSLLREDIYEDFQALDVKTSLSASAKTTQEIQAAYQAQDNKCADFEYYVIDFIQRVLDLAGIEDNPTFVWNRVVNQQEQTQMVLSAANYLTEDVLIKHLPFLTPEEADAIIAERTEADADQFGATYEEAADMDSQYIAEFGDEVTAMLESLLGDEE